MTPLVRLWLEWRNSFDLGLRSQLRWSPRGREMPEDKAQLWDGLPGDAGKGCQEKESRWTPECGLVEARARMTRARWLRNLAVLEVLDQARRNPRWARALGQSDPLQVLDIGSKNFDYVDALQGFLTRGGRRPVSLTGLELDAYRRTTDLRTRLAWANFYCSFVPSARYLPRDLEDQRGQYGIITWFFPFVTEFPLVRWGLPPSRLKPQALFDHAYQLLAPGGLMLILNLNEQESRIQRQLIEVRGIEYDFLGPIPGSFGEKGREQRATLVRKARTAGPETPGSPSGP